MEGVATKPFRCGTFAVVVAAAAAENAVAAVDGD